MTRTFNVYCQTKTVLQTFLPERQAPAYSLTVKTHNKALIDKTANLNEQNFFYSNLLCMYIFHSFILF